MPFYNPTSDLPPALASLLEPNSGMPSYQLGGMVGPGGAPMRPGMGPGLAPPGAAQQTLSPEQIQPEVQRFMQQNPQQVQQMYAMLQQLIQTGQVTVQELNMMVQMARAAAQNPEMYPQLRQIAIQRGIAGPDEISEQFDSGLIFTLLLLGAVLQSGGMGPNMPSLKKGGMLPKKNGSDSDDSDDAVIAQLHEGEYVIPAHIVRAKGTEFFDKMLQSYKENGSESDD